jgi:flagellar basal-body rod modification protein FlgD
MSIPATEAVSNTGLLAQVNQATQESGDKQLFLELMVAQLRYQDPMNPTDSAEFLAQSAQFTALEKMQAVADQTAELLSVQLAFGASSLVGRTVSYPDADGNTATGVVNGVTFGSSGPVLDVSGTDVALTDVRSVTDGSTPPTSA